MHDESEPHSMNESTAPDADRPAEPMIPSRVPEQPPKTFDFDEMSDGGNLVFIRFNGVDYRLQRTRNQRLILQK